MERGFRTAYIYVRSVFAGTLQETDEGYLFQYDPQYLSDPSAPAVSLTLPRQEAPFLSRTLFAFFDGLIPEGWLLHLVSRNWKIDQRDRFGLLLVACKDCIGAVSIRGEKRVVFSFVVGNSDMHLKNFSLIETAAGSQNYVLSQAYDMLPVNVILPEDNEQLALTVNGKKQHIHRNDFIKFAESSGIPREAAGKMIQKLLSLQDKYLRLCEESFLPDHLKERLSSLIIERTDALKPGNVR